MDYEKIKKAAANIPQGMTLDEVRAAAVLSSLQKNDHNRRWTALELGVSVRTLRVYIKTLRLLGFKLFQPSAGSGRKKGKGMTPKQLGEIGDYRGY